MHTTYCRPHAIFLCQVVTSPLIIISKKKKKIQAAASMWIFDNMSHC